MHDENLLENLFDSKSLRVLRLFIDDKGNEFYLREIAKKSNVPVPKYRETLIRLVQDCTFFP